jgi:adenosine deaminase
VLLAELKQLPKTLLHDHLDGGLRPATLIDIATEIDLELPSYDPTELQTQIFSACNEGDLEKYLKNFDYTIAAMQSRDHIIRIARECVEDLAADGVTYAEVRGAPELFTRGGLSIGGVIEATLKGYEEGMQNVRDSGKEIEVRAILCAMRHEGRSLEVAHEALKYREEGVVGFDIAGPERGFPASKHRAAFELLNENNFPFTIHAGEAGPFEYIEEAILKFKAKRIGHGFRLLDELVISEDEVTLTDKAKLILDSQVHIEMAPTSNLQTGLADSYESHPAALFHKLGFNVALNTDNRLMSSTTLSEEYQAMATAHSWNIDVIKAMNKKALEAAFY